ncbi:MAG: hypothetical protein CBC48_02230 [bacterium TMED88]|nr:hypothetical protein [Deltaproteobacteria bacterium]OUV36420.1 MAG: hypothetical protein CBC48_02230 [bacterium TMED88]
MKRPVVVVAATSGIGRAIARRLGQDGTPLILAGRDGPAASRIASDCKARFSIEAEAVEVDMLHVEEITSFIEHIKKLAPNGIDGLITCQGAMPDQEDLLSNPEMLQDLVKLNFTSVVILFEAVARALSETGGGFLCAITSVAADRGRPRHHLYGSTKSALTTYLEGLRVRLHPRDIKVVNIKPGVVDTAMTWGLSNSAPMASPDRVAKDTLRAIDRNRPVAYSPAVFSLIMKIVRAIPDRLFNRLDF